MNGINSRIFGCSMEGFLDSVYLQGEPVYEDRNYLLKDVVLPKNHTDRFIIGNKAKYNSRVCTGLSWPPIAKVVAGNFLRRVPISILLRLMQDAGDSNLKWRVDKSLSIQLSKIYAKYINDCLKNLSNCERLQSKYDTIVVSIPNELDEFWQEEILKELRREGYYQVKLVWRPVAAALSWLDKTQHDFPDGVHENDFIIVIHIGTDSIELIPFKLRERVFKGSRYIIPLREVVNNPIKVAGFDLAAKLIEKTLGINDLNAFWYSYLFFPDVWKVLAQSDGILEEPPQPLFCDDEWKLWQPNYGEQINEFWRTNVESCEQLQNLLEPSTKQKRSINEGLSWQSFLRKELNQILQNNKGRLQGILFSGPICSTDPVVILDSKIDDLKRMGFSGFYSTSPEINSVQIRSKSHNLVADGASIYGERLKTGAPSFLDILPEMSLLVQKRGDYEWYRLTKDNEVEGGKPYINNLEFKDTGFSLGAGKDSVTVYLKRKNAFKKLNVEFPFSPNSSVGLDTHIEMSPAGGQAKVTFEPISENFLKGRRYLFDFSSMEDIENPIADLKEKKKLGYPSIKSPIRADPSDSRIHFWKFQKLINNIQNEHYYSEQYEDLLDNLIQKLDVTVKEDGIIGKIVDFDGKCSTVEGQKVLVSLSRKLGNDLKQLLQAEVKSDIVQDKLNKILRASARLYKNAAENIIQYVSRNLEELGEAANQMLIDPAGRMFSMKPEISRLFKAIYERTINPVSGMAFPVYSAKAVLRILEWRAAGPFAMSAVQANAFLKNSLNRIYETCILKHNYKIVFFENIKLFLYIFRFREADSSFLAPDQKNTKLVVNQMQEYIADAIEYFEVRLSSARYSIDRQRYKTKIDGLLKIKQGVEKYMNYEGSADVIQVLDEFIAEDGQ
jgi:hypothetical protein